MIQKFRNRMNSLSNDKGFTLIEIAIVLIIIGIILGAIVKGKDIVKGSEQKKLYTKFVNSWNLAFNSYYDRTGWILGDVDNPANDPGRDGQCSAASEANLEAQLTAVGLTVPDTGPSGNSTDRQYKDSTGALHTIALVFDYSADLGNFLRITSNRVAAPFLPVDLGIALDRIIDGEANGTSGDLLYSDDGTATTVALDAWSVAPADANAAIIFKLEF